MTPEQEARRARRRAKRDDWKQRARDVDAAIKLVTSGDLLSGHQRLLACAAMSGSSFVRAERLYVEKYAPYSWVGERTDSEAILIARRKFKVRLESGF